MEITGRVALVTGANRGLGAAIVDALVEAGASRVYAAMRVVERRAANAKVVPLSLDVTRADLVEAAAEQCSEVSILVNNAGLSEAQPLLAARDPSAAEREMRVNYFGTLAMCRAFAPVLARHGGGAIVNVLSILGRVPIPTIGSYSASKAAAHSLTQSIRSELAPRGTLVVGVLPGFIDTDMASRVVAPKLSASEVATTILDALETGTEDVYPGLAADVESALRRDPKAVERQFASFAVRP